MTAAVGPSTHRRGLTARRWWPAAKRITALTFFALVAALIVHQARLIDWSQVWASLQRQTPSTLACAAALAACGHLLYSTLDLIGRHLIGHRLPVPRVMAAGFISYAFNLNFGSLIGALALRYRLYGRMGLNRGRILRIVALSMFSNWMGYAAVAGVVVLSAPLNLPEHWQVAGATLQVAGAIALAAVLGYLLACARAKRRTWTLRGQHFTLPSARVAALQIGLAACHWCLIGGIVHLLLEQRIDYVAVMQVMLLAAVAGVVTHVPAGIGVLEAVVVGLLASRLPAAELIGALLAYRFFYYLMPLAAAGGLYFVLEARPHSSTPAADT